MLWKELTKASVLAVKHAQNKSADRRKRRSVEPWLSGFGWVGLSVVICDNLLGKSVTMIPSFSSRIKKSFGTLTTVFNVSCWNTAIGINGSVESSSGWSSDWKLDFLVVVNFDGDSLKSSPDWSSDWTLDFIVVVNLCCGFLLIWVFIGFCSCCCPSSSSSPPCCSWSVRRPVYFFVDVDDGVEVEVEVEVDDSDV